MKERQIPMNAPMVRATLDGSKTQTRRIVKGHALAFLSADHKPILMCPYGKPGDQLWVREAWRTVSDADPIPPRLMTAGFRLWFEADIPHQPGYGRLRPGMFMPRWASRITLEIVSVRVERLQDISEADCWSEGIEACDGLLDDVNIINCAKRMRRSFEDAAPTYAALWESINGPGSWDINPWVWVIEFKRL